MGGEGLELHTYTWPLMDSIDLDPQPILGIGQIPTIEVQYSGGAPEFTYCLPK